MSDCRETQLQLTEYSAGDLGASDAAEVARHEIKPPKFTDQADEIQKDPSVTGGFPVMNL